MSTQMFSSLGAPQSNIFSEMILNNKRAPELLQKLLTNYITQSPKDDVAVDQPSVLQSIAAAACT
jgi:hypothetical protein